MSFSKHLLVFAAVALALAGCKKEVVVPVADDGANYFPLEVGKYRVYDVDSIHFNDVTMTSDTTRFQIKEEITAQLQNESSFDANTRWYELNVYRRADTGQSWQQTHYATEGVSPVRAERVENNLHFINLVFPVALGKSWSGNAFISDSTETIYSPDWQYAYANVDTNITFDGNVYTKCIVVTQFNNQNLIEKDIEREIYAYGIGLVYKESTHVERQDIANPVWTPEKGTIVTRRLREHN